METTASDVFKFLQENIPSWVVNLDRTSRDSTEHQGHLADGTSSSLDTYESHTEIHHLGNGELQKVVIVPYRNGAGLTRQSSSTDYQRRSSLSIGSDGALFERSNYRARNAIVVNYNSDAQNRLENVVSGVCQAKDMIRKALASRQRRTLPLRRQLPNLGSIDIDKESEDDDEDDELDEELVLAQIRMRRHGRSLTTREQSFDNENDEADTEQREALEKIRGQLDLIQDLCSDSAFQLLRDGNCVAEMYQAMEALAHVLNIMASASANSKAREIIKALNCSVSEANPIDLAHSHHLTGGEHIGDIKLPVAFSYRLDASSP